MFITQLLNRASSMMWAVIQNKNKTKQQKTKKPKKKKKTKTKKKKTTTTTTKQQQKQTTKKTNKQTKNIMPAAVRYQHQMYMRFRHCTMDE